MRSTAPSAELVDRRRRRRRRTPGRRGCRDGTPRRPSSRPGAARRRGRREGRRGYVERHRAERSQLDRVADEPEVGDGDVDAVHRRAADHPDDPHRGLQGGTHDAVVGRRADPRPRPRRRPASSMTIATLTSPSAVSSAAAATSASAPGGVGHDPPAPGRAAWRWSPACRPSDCRTSCRGEPWRSSR